MMLVDHDDRLVAVNGDATVAKVWSRDRKAWVDTSADFARKAWLEGDKLTKQQAEREFPEADLEALETV